MAEQVEVAKLAETAIAAYNAQDWASAAALRTADFAYEDVAAQQRTTGLTDYIAALKGWAVPFPDRRVTLTRVRVCDDAVVMEFTYEATHTGPLTGPFGPIPPTGKRVVVPMVDIATLAGDKIKAERVYADLLTIFQQLGAIPRPAEVAGAARG